MTKYIVLKDKYRKGKYSAVDITIKKDDHDMINDLISIIFANGTEQKINKNWIYDTKEQALQVSREREIVNNYKLKTEVNGRWVCSSCGMEVTRADATVDHITPVSNYKKRGKYISKKHWQQCWSESNLTIMCHNCNLSKSRMSAKKHLHLNKKSTYIKLRTLKKRNNKIANASFELARKDSRILDKNIILKQKPLLWEKLRC